MQYTIIFIDTEGTPIQELSALEMDYDSRELVDAFHGYAQTSESDRFARKHIHGLNPDFLSRKGYSNAYKLITAFKEWLEGKNYAMCWGNAPAKEIQELKMYVADIGLDQWIHRDKKPYHCVAFSFKKHNIPILSKRCCAEAHSSFENVYVRPSNKTDAAKERWGHHCSFYDCYEMYLCYVTTD